MKASNIKSLPPAFFTMVNSLAICLLVIAKKEKPKIKAFVNFWMEKIEIEGAEQPSLDFPKYVLRNTLCNLLYDLELYCDCIKLCNFSVREITSELKLADSSHADKKDLKDKVRLMILAWIYKVDCLVALKHGTAEACLEILQKCKSLMAKFGLDQDAALKNTIITKEKKLEEADFGYSTEAINDGRGLSRSTGNLSERNPKKNFIIKTKNTFDLSETPRSKEFVFAKKIQKNKGWNRSPTDHSPKLAKFDRSSPKSIAFSKNTKLNFSIQNGVFSESLKKKRVPSSISGKGILRNKSRNPQQHMTTSIVDQKINKEFQKEMKELFQLSTSLKQELESLKAMKLQSHNALPKRKADRILEDSNFDGSRHSDDYMNTEIQKKVQSILDGQVEWEKQRRIFNEKLEKIEKNIEKTMDDTSSNTQHPLPPKDSCLRKQPRDKETKDSRRTSFSIGVQDPKPKVTSLRMVPEVSSHVSKKTLVKAGSTTSAVSQKSKSHQLRFATFEKMLDICLRDFDKPTNAATLVDIPALRHVLEERGQKFDVLYDMKQGSGRNLTDSVLTIKVFKEDAKCSGKPLAVESLGGGNLDYVFKNLQALEVIPSNLPITSLIHTGYMINFVLHKFVRVIFLDQVESIEPDNWKIVIDPSPKSLFPDDLETTFMGQQCSISLVHMRRNVFRLLIRPSR